jgi:hypothetical protein
MEIGVDFQALGECFADMCKDMLETNCPQCKDVLNCILYPRCCVTAGVKWAPQDPLGWELTVCLIETGEEEEKEMEIDLEVDAEVGYDFLNLTPEDTEALWVVLQNCRFTQPQYRESIERLLTLVWMGVSGNEADEAPLIYEVPDFLELAQEVDKNCESQ